MKTIQSLNITLAQVRHLFKYQRERIQAFTDILSLEPLSEREQDEIEQMQSDFESYFVEGMVSEGQIKLLSVSPLLKLAGFYKPPIKIILEEDISDIIIEDQNTKITGRIDLLAIQTKSLESDTPFWVLVLESKNGNIAPSAGLAQILTYAYTSLQSQTSVWGLLTNGEYYQFIYLQSGEQPIYNILPSLNFLETELAQTTLQVLKAIRNSITSC
jgi:hypothetical protein